MPNAVARIPCDSTIAITRLRGAPSAAAHAELAAALPHGVREYAVQSHRGNHEADHA